MTDLIVREPSSEAGVPGNPEGRAAVLRGRLGGVLDTVEQLERIAGATAAARAELVDAARRVSEAIAAEGSYGTLGSEPRGWNSATRCRR